MTALSESIAKLEKEIERHLKSASSSKEVEELRVKYLGKKGPVQDLMKLLRSVSEEERPSAGKLINDLKEKIEARLQELKLKFEFEEGQKKLSQESLDISLPGRRRFFGRKHPLLQMLDRMVEIMIEMGFSVQLGPDIESDYYNFESLNYTKDHPARDMQDTFYLTPEFLLRTHNTSIQARIMEQTKPPIRIVCPGTVYRNEEITARSHVFFHQVDILYIDKNVTLADLQTTVQQFFEKLIGPEAKVRIRPSYFPFVEPGAEIDVLCLLCKGCGCSLCKQTGWLEVAGAGMVHPEVLRNGGIDPQQYSGFAWGMGTARLMMIQKGIKDIRFFTQNDMRFLEQFP